MYRSLLSMLRRLQSQGQDYDLIDAHYIYPDGVAAVRLGQRLGKPVVITARGTDVTLIPRYRLPRRQILWAVEHAAAIVTVSKALKQSLVTLGVAPDRITVLRNGVDLGRFRPLAQTNIRRRMSLTGPVWLSVGHLVELKGVHIVIKALAKVSGVTLLVAGSGPQEGRLRRLADRLAVSDRVRFLGEIPHDELDEYYNAADALMLASSREGMPNVVLEALACGTPVIATCVGGTPELVSSPDAGELMQERTPDALVLAWKKLQARKPERASTRAFAEKFGWEPTTRGLEALFTRVLPESGNQQGIDGLKNP